MFRTGVSRRGKVAATVALAAVLAVSAGCSSDGEAEESAAPSVDVQVDESVQALVPTAVRDRGSLRVATMNNYKPYSYTDGSELVGMIPEMATAVAGVMGLTADITAIEFPSILTGLQAQRYDIGMGEYFVREDRLEVADFVTEWSNYNAFVIRQGSEYKPESIDDVCGRAVAILAGSSGVPAMDAGVAKCAEAGEPAPIVSTFPVMSEAVLALTSQRVDAVLTGREVGIALVDDGVPVEASGRVGGGPTATAVARSTETEGLPEAIAAAYAKLIEDGTYASIHEKWKTDYGMIEDPTVYRMGDVPPTYAS
ncbi:transporter substrate-binding domain-containing protein [Rhodococcoides kyotonense]|uniref:Polar amino acid transport system substrate-binding protein n=1 Tax=Rhodococcoides kyotonense TaxID=398843 RepID=A0A239N719_9NOCA|nr:transporter substrate-binding domain-containing protein [Rhodococcus kyotonensis]SNT50807.1 polar amino acid transport system substrate-binding protein [Rhodococcus kyotonensis]